jgi:PqqD family protein of HPr-rel-A system
VGPSFTGVAAWRTVSLADLHWRVWEEQYVVYNDLSGHTHLLDPMAALILREIDEYCETAELVERLAALLEVKVDDDLRGSIERTLAELDKLYLIERVNGADATAGYQ